MQYQNPIMYGLIDNSITNFREYSMEGYRSKAIMGRTLLPKRFQAIYFTSGMTIVGDLKKTEFGAQQSLERKINDIVTNDKDLLIFLPKKLA